MQSTAEFSLRRPNELGRIPVIMYHSVDNTRPFDRHGLNVSRATFYKHLSLMQKYGLYPINMRDLRSHASLAQVPKGYVPVVITFDDGRKSQFKLNPDGTTDSHCAIGMLEDFIRNNARNWRKRATFYVMPKSSYNLEPFQQSGLAVQKLKYLVDAGYEVGNHTWSHRSLRNMTASQVSSELMRCYYGIKSLCPQATMDTLCVPFGAYPRVSSWRTILVNPLKQRTNMHSMVLMAWGGPSYSPFDNRFDKLRVTRIGVSPNELEVTLQRLARTESWYVSGGEEGVLHIPSKLKKYLAKEKLDGLTVSIN